MFSTTLRNLLLAATSCSIGMAFPCVYATESPAVQVAGVYELLICKGSCMFGDNRNVVVRGNIVLLANPLHREDIDRLDKAYYPTRYKEVPNGCFALARLPDRAYSGLAGADSFGVTAWLMNGSTLRLALAHTSDAGYDATVQPVPEGFEGRGITWGGALVSTSGIPNQTDQIIARRTGDADVRDCFRLHQTGAEINSRSH